MIPVVLLFIVANVGAALTPVTDRPPQGRRILLGIEAVIAVISVPQIFGPEPYDEWGMGGLGQGLLAMSLLLLLLSSIPVSSSASRKG